MSETVAKDTVRAHARIRPQNKDGLQPWRVDPVRRGSPPKALKSCTSGPPDDTAPWSTA